MTEDPLQALLGRGPFPGAVLGLDVGGGEQRTLVSGVTRAYADPAGTPLPLLEQPPVGADTLYDLASLTKLVTATVVLVLVERGALALDDPVTHYLPAFGDGREHVTVRHLLTHTAGLPADTFAWREHTDPPARRAAVLTTPLLDRPGTGYRYSCVGYLVLGLLVEQIAGPLDALVQQEVALPLGLVDLGYRPLDRGVDVDRIAATELRPGAGDTRGVVHDENAASWGGAAGNAGLFGTAADLVGLGRAMLDLLAGRATPLALSPASAREMVTAGLGWRVDDASFMGPLAGRGRAYGHTGFTGTSLVLDEDRDLVVALLTNRVHPSRGWTELNPFRRELAGELERTYPLRRLDRSDGR